MELAIDAFLRLERFAFLNGYPKAFVETWTYELITLIALKSAPPRTPGR